MINARASPTDPSTGALQEIMPTKSWLQCIFGLSFSSSPRQRFHIVLVWPASSSLCCYLAATGTNRVIGSSNSIVQARKDLDNSGIFRVFLGDPFRSLPRNRTVLFCHEKKDVDGYRLRQNEQSQLEEAAQRAVEGREDWSGTIHQFAGWIFLERL